MADKKPEDDQQSDTTSQFQTASNNALPPTTDFGGPLGNTATEKPADPFACLKNSEMHLKIAREHGIF